MRKPSLIAILMFFICLAPVARAQYVFEGKLVDADTGEPVKYARLWISDLDNGIDTLIYANEGGNFRYELADATYLYIQIEVENYHELQVDYEVTGDEGPATFRMYKYGSESYRIEDIAEQDFIDFNLGFDFFAPAFNDADDKFKSTFTFDYAYEVKFKIATNTQVGLRYMPLRVKWMNMNSDTTLTTIPHDKERYFEASTGIGVFMRYIISTMNDGWRGAFVDLGVNYTIPYYFGYAFFTEKHLKTSQNKIHRFNDLQAMLRLGYGWGSIRAAYRFTDIMKGGFIEPSKLTLGIEFNVPVGLHD